ncbi:putative RNA methyltransferase [Pseudomonas neustonica]|uniref:Methyltransferase domain-containing protein n=1 Tax=Pseudomonas neustonica TaxID=2487346 RepID=A0ABX9XN50_9PSED|nr:MULTISPECIES: methyltransferase domain-containing protein [Pseudomonas]MBA6418586.1 methyltransferase domain-containing protein [Pseudomonas sp. 5Ae-yellow]ROZ85033.1 methyltransferase domain-containing protein [Pseudomonas sp. SSM44]ROZ86680.1 methyltransferase domain-containing protein [Pseudomonas neustonica]|tara:strand:- start:16084 stop:16887 length:804 start_codon:yes stop_codon:yes gene_type:complete
MIELICPHCHDALLQTDRQWRCVNGHSYDQARQGYLNLLLVQHKNSKQPGDTPQMLSHRQAFLDAGHYQPVSDAINQLLVAETPARVLDMGCGEGYYTSRLASVLPQAQLAGLDISKDAILKACRRSKDIQWLVASSARLPVADQSLDAALCVFSPWSPEECVRTLRPGGKVLIVGPHGDHLMALREKLYDSVHPTPELIKSLPDELHIVSQSTLRYALQVPADELANLIGMTPHGFRSQQERQQALCASGIEGLEVAMQMVLLERS